MFDYRIDPVSPDGSELRSQIIFQAEMRQFSTDVLAGFTRQPTPLNRRNIYFTTTIQQNEEN